MRSKPKRLEFMRFLHTLAMDVVSCARAFVAVARLQSFSDAARDGRTTQPVISRRVAALEDYLGGSLLERSTRQVSLTSLGAGILAHAQTLIRAERSLLDAASSFRRGTVRLLVPRLDPAVWAPLRLRALGTGVDLQIEEEDREQRSLRFQLGEADASVLPVETARADWIVPLGLAQATDRTRPPTLASLRPTRAMGPLAAARISVLAEDASVQVLSALRQAAAESGLAAHQVYEAASVIYALTGALAGDEWVLCSREQAAAWRLQWFAVPDLTVARTYRLESHTAGGRKLFSQAIRREIAEALGDAGRVQL